MTILLSDARGQPAVGVDAQQTVYAGHDTVLPGEPSRSGPGGALRFTVEQPDWAGPQALDVDVDWQANEHALVTGFATPFPRFTEVLPAASDPEALATPALYQIGAIGDGGEMGIAALGRDPGDGQRPVHLYLYDPDLRDVTRVSSAPVVRAKAIGVVWDAEAARDRVVAMSSNVWYRIDPDGSVDASMPGSLMDAVALAPVSDCSKVDAPRDHLLAVSSSGQVGLYQADGTRVTSWRGAELDNVTGLLAAGCVRGLEVTYPAAVYSIQPAGPESERAMLAIDETDAQATPVNAAVDRGFAFTPLLDGGEGPFLLANRFENDGNSIARYTVVPVDGAPTFLDEGDEDEIAGLCASSAGGDFDGDGHLDVAAMVTVPTGEGRVVFRFFMALGIDVEEQRLFGLGATGIDNPDFKPLLLTANFDGDEYDELFLATPEGFSVFELEPE